MIMYDGSVHSVDPNEDEPDWEASFAKEANKPRLREYESLVIAEMNALRPFHDHAVGKRSPLALQIDTDTNTTDRHDKLR